MVFQLLSRWGWDPVHKARKWNTLLTLGGCAAMYGTMGIGLS